MTWWGLSLPAVGLDRARWFYWAFACIVALMCVPVIVFQAGRGVPTQVAGLVGIGALIAVRSVEFRRGRLLEAWSEVPLALALGCAASAADPLSAGVGLFFTKLLLPGCVRLDAPHPVGDHRFRRIARSLRAGQPNGLG